MLRTLVTLFATQMLAPSYATASGWVPAVSLPSPAPRLGCNLTRLLLPSLAAQMFAPSEA